MPEEQFAFWLDQLGSNIIKVDAGQSLIEMQLPGFAVLVQALPIEHAIGGVAVLLDLN